ncbi:MAG: PH domain-containing protein [Gorillibacterium sp.]|nr:PH domain-containing protein [Gorillibacterium sp.]
MDRDLTQRHHPNYLKVALIRSLIIHAGLFGLTIIYLLIAISKGWALYPGWISAGLFAVTGFLYTFTFPKIRSRWFAFDVFDEELEIRTGFIFVRNVLVPMVRVQHVELESGPLLRAYGLADISVVTAATTHRIVGLTRENAEEIKWRIGTLAKVADDDE